MRTPRSIVVVSALLAPLTLSECRQKFASAVLQPPTVDFGDVEVGHVNAGCTQDHRDETIRALVTTTGGSHAYDTHLISGGPFGWTPGFNLPREFQADRYDLEMQFEPPVTGLHFGEFWISFPAGRASNRVTLVGRGICLAVDTDSDGVWDINEDPNENGVVDPGETDPQNADSDSDGLEMA